MGNIAEQFSHLGKYQDALEQFQRVLGKEIIVILDKPFAILISFDRLRLRKRELEPLKFI